MPFHAAPVNNETEAIAGFLAQQQDAFRSVIYGLTDAQAALSPTVSALSVGGLVKHVTACQENWLQYVLAAPHERVLDPDAAQAAYGDDFNLTETDTVEALLKAYDDVSARVLEAANTIDLSTSVPIPDAPWNPNDIDAWSVRWIWFHLIEELARHAGHADIVREGIDGATMFALIAGREGFPETPWLKPWTAA